MKTKTTVDLKPTHTLAIIEGLLCVLCPISDHCDFFTFESEKPTIKENNFPPGYFDSLPDKEKYRSVIAADDSPFVLPTVEYYNRNRHEFPEWERVAQ